MRKLSTEEGMSRTATYRHFKDKNDVLCAFAVEGFNKLHCSFKQVNDNSSKDVVDHLRKIGIAYFNFAVENPNLYRMMFGNEITKNKRTSELIDEACEAFGYLVENYFPKGCDFRLTFLRQFFTRWT